MATKNLVPRENNEGNIGVSSRKWKNAFFTNGNFDKVLTDELKNISDNELLVAGDNITITYNTTNKNYTIASTASGGGSILSLNDLSDATVTSPLTGHILVYSSDDPTVLKNVALSGDATIDAAGALTIGSGAIKTAMVNANVITGQTAVEDEIADSDLVLVYDTSASALRKITKANFVTGLGATLNIDDYSALDGPGLHQTQDHFIFSDDGTEKKITFSNLQDAIFAGVSGDASIAAGGALTIAPGAVDSSMLAGSIANSKLTNSSITIGSTAISLGSTASDIAGLGSLVVDNITIDGNTISSTDTNGNIILDPNGTGEISVSSAKVTNLGTPTANTDAATKSYVDSVATGLSPTEAVKAATTANLSVTATNTTLTASSNGAFSVDSNVSPAFAEGDRILVKDQSTQTQNGIYKITTLGNGSTDFVLTRTSDFDNGLTTAAGVFVFVVSGSTNGKKGFVCISPDGSDTVGTHNIIWSSFSSAGSFGAGKGISLNGTDFELDLHSNTGLVDFATNDSNAALVKKDDELAIKDTSNSSTNKITVEKFVTDILDTSTDSGLSVDTANDYSKIKLDNIPISKISNINNNRVLGYLSSTDDTSSVAEIEVKSSSDADSWDNPSDVALCTQKSIDEKISASMVTNTSGNTTITHNYEEDFDSYNTTPGSQGTGEQGSEYDLGVYYNANGNNRETALNTVFELVGKEQSGNLTYNIKLPNVNGALNSVAKVGDALKLVIKNQVQDNGKQLSAKFHCGFTDTKLKVGSKNLNSENFNFWGGNSSYSVPRIEVIVVLVKNDGGGTSPKRLWKIFKTDFS